MRFIWLGIIFAFLFIASNMVHGQSSCPLKTLGGANCDGTISLADFEVWRREFLVEINSTNANFNNDSKVTISDFEIWRRTYTSSIAQTSPTATPVVSVIPTGSPTRPVVSTAPGGPLRAFPQAEGFAAETVGGRGGRVIEVTNLNDSGTGSLRDCISAGGARTCVFRVAGTIVLSSNLDINNPFLTLAGQTAPGGGITLKSADSSSTVHLRVQTHDVVIRYIRARPGTTVVNARALTVSNSSPAPFNVVIDHVSLSWSGDEMFITWYDTNNVTLQWSSISESLPAGDGGLKGPNLGDEGASGYLSLHHNLLAHHNQRFPLTRTGVGPIDLVNNVMYNLGEYGYANLRNNTKANLINNYVKPGPNSTISTFVRDSEISGGGYFHSGNVVEPGGSVSNFSPDAHRVSTRYSSPPVTTVNAQQAFEQVLTKAGAVHGLNCDGTWSNRPDAVDLRIFQSVRDGTRGHNIPPAQTDRQLGFISDPSDVGGWPTLASGTPCSDADHDGMADDWEMIKFGSIARGSSSVSTSDCDRDGYTDLEEFLNATNPKDNINQCLD